jgi:diguanylate cyclase (GGDEF)-like protein
MFHSPAPIDDHTDTEREAAVSEQIDFDIGNKRLRAAHLHNGQVRVRALFAPFLAIAALAAALFVAWTMYGSVATPLLAGWVAVVALANGISSRVAIIAMRNAGGRDIEPVTKGWTWASGGLALLWLSLPTYGFIAGPPGAQPAIGVAIAAMVTTSIALVATPVALVVWLAAFLGGLLLIVTMGYPETGFGQALILLFGVAAFGTMRLARWVFGQMKEVAGTRAEAESIRQLLNEYERRGVGWLWQVDSENRVIYISSRMAALIGRSTNQLAGHSLPAALGGTGALGRILLSRQPFANLEMELSTRRGTRWISLSADPIIDMAGDFQGFRGVGQDVTDVRRTQERLTNLANMDVLSGLPNRGRVRQLLGEALSNLAGRQLLGEALSSSAGNDTLCAILFLDLDGFKPVNDTFGHPKGDAVLKSVAQRLVKEVGPFGHVGRMGGDEFAIVIKDAQSRGMVETLAGRLIAAIAEPFHIDKVEIRIGVSIGCAFGPVDGQSVDDLIQKADVAVYQAKAAGGDTACFFNPEMKTRAESRQSLEGDLARGIEAGEFRLLYQPLIAVKDQGLVGFEALIRWDHPTRGLIAPDTFIPLAEDSGLIIKIGEWAINEACRAAKFWPDTISVAVNVSARQLIFPDLPDLIENALHENDLGPSRLELEVTESVFMGDSENALEVLKRIKALGVCTVLDDFGTGYSTLGYLNKAVFQKLKIDGSFVRESGKNKDTVAIIKSIVQLAKGFRMTVTAEGVETMEDFNRMRDLGCRHVQGYLFGRPTSFESATRLARPAGYAHGDIAADDATASDAEAADAREEATGAVDNLPSEPAYDYWKRERFGLACPSILDLDPQIVGELGPNSMLLDVSHDPKDPQIIFLGHRILIECGLPLTLRLISETPICSLPSRLSDHYLQVVAGSSPIGFERAFVDRRGQEALARGTLLPLAGNGMKVAFILCVVDFQTTRESGQQASALPLLPEPGPATAGASLSTRRRKGGAVAADRREESAQRPPFAAFVMDEATAGIVRSVARWRGWPEERVAFGGVEAAIQALATTPSPSILLFDLSGHDDPLPTVARLSEAWEPDTLVVACGDANDLSFYRALIDLGVADYLPKPVTHQQLSELLDEVERGKRARMPASVGGR